MTRNEIYNEYAAAAKLAGVAPKANTSFQNKQGIANAMAALPKPTPVATKKSPVKTLSNIVLSGKAGFIHEKLDATQRARARRWWKRLEESSCPVDHEHRARWSTSKVPAELCKAIGVKCHPEPRS
jgi:hypothetical protein